MYIEVPHDLNSLNDLDHLTAPDARSLRLIGRDESREIDRRAEAAYHLPGLILMENASINLSRVILERLDPDRRADRIWVVCGGGNNGGDGYAAARHLHNDGRSVTIIALKPPREPGDAATNAAICRAMKLPIISLDEAPEHVAPGDLVIDAIFGTGLDRPVEGDPARAIGWINACGGRVVAVDCPSGLDAQRGEVPGGAVRAEATVTFAGIKPGLLTEQGRTFAGRLFVAEIGAPRELIERFGRPLGEVAASIDT